MTKMPATILLLGACTIKQIIYEEPPDDAKSIDAIASDGSPQDARADAAVDARPDAMADAAPPACPALGSGAPSGHHAANGVGGDPGATVISAHEGCMGQAGCHNAALGGVAAGDAWSYGGEVFVDAAGTIPYPGTWIVLSTGSDGSATTTMLEVSENGFFWLPASSNFPAPSATTSVSTYLCGSGETEMATPLAAVEAGPGTDGNCSAGGCHTDSQGAQTGAFIH